MVALRCPCQQGSEVWAEFWWTGAEHRWVFFDDDERSETYAEQVERCPACGKPLERLLARGGANAVDARRGYGGPR
jgi:hypothetical protein